MSAPAAITERDAVLREREAYAKAMHRARCPEYNVCEPCKRRAAEAYPLPKVTRPRVVTDSIGAMCYRVVNDVTEWADVDADNWRPMMVKVNDLIPEQLAALADLWTNPTEEVEDTP